MKTPSTKDTIGCANEVKQPKVIKLGYRTYSERMIALSVDKIKDILEAHDKDRNERRLWKQI